MYGLCHDVITIMILPLENTLIYLLFHENGCHYVIGTFMKLIVLQYWYYSVMDTIMIFTLMFSYRPHAMLSFLVFKALKLLCCKCHVIVDLSMF